MLMMNFEELEPLERETLRIVRHGNGNYGWYQVARVLPVYDYPEEDQNAAKILSWLEQLGLIKSTPAPSATGHLRYAITEAGLSTLDQLGIKPSLSLGY